MALKLLIYLVGWLSFGTAMACDFSGGSSNDLAMPKYDKVIDRNSETLGNGQFVKWHIYTLNGDVVSLAREYFTDDSSALYRLIPMENNEFIITMSTPGSDSGPNYSFKICADGSFATPLPGPFGHSPSETREFAKALRDDFFLLKDIEPYRSEFLDRYK